MVYFIRRAAIPCLLQLLICFIVIAPARAQTCNDVELTSQAEVDAFDCTWVGNLTIGAPGNEDDITDLSPLADLTTVVEFLRIRNNDLLTSLEGLGALRYVGEATQGTGGLEIANNPALTTLAGLSSLYSVYGLRIEGNESLTSLEGLESLSRIPWYGGLVIKNNPSLESLSGLGDVNGLFSVHIEGNTVLTSLEGLEGISSVGAGIEAKGGLTISDNDALTTLEGLEGLVNVPGGLYIEGNEVLSSLAVLDGIGDIGVDLVIEGNPSLTSLTGLEGVTSVGRWLHLEDNDALESLQALQHVSTVGPAPENGAGRLSIIDNDGLESLHGLHAITSIRGSSPELNVYNNDSLGECSNGLSGLISCDPPAFSGLGGTVTIEGNDPTGTCTSPPVVLATFCDGSTSGESGPALQNIELALYPNPLAGALNIRYSTAGTESVSVRIALYDLLGRELNVFVDSVQPAGDHEVQFGLRGLASGVYVVRLEVGKEVRTQRLTVVE